MKPPTSLLEGLIQLLQTPEHHRLSSDKLLDRWALSRAGISKTDAYAIVCEGESDDVGRALERVENGHAPDQVLRTTGSESARSEWTPVAAGIRNPARPRSPTFMSRVPGTGFTF